MTTIHRSDTSIVTSDVRVGGPHFSGLMRQIRHQSYTLFAAVTDLIDNVIGRSDTCVVIYEFSNGRIRRIIMHDECEKGFENINKEYEENPFNLTHIRDGHKDDSETSEFGTGMKQAMIALGSYSTVITLRINEEGQREFWKVYHDYDEMASKTSSPESYEPTLNRPISEDQYHSERIIKQTCGFKLGYGSTFIIEGLESGCAYNIIPDIGEFAEKNNRHLTNTFGKTNISITTVYREVKKGGIKLSGIIRRKKDVFKDEKLSENIVISKKYVTFSKDDMIKEIHSVTEYKSEKQYYKYNFEKKGAKRWEKSRSSVLELAIQREDYVTMDGKSTSLEPLLDQYGKLHLDGEEIPAPNNNISIYRNGRHHGSPNFMWASGVKNYTGDNYGRFILNEFHWTSKRLNSHLGMQTNKKINEHKETLLTGALGAYQKLMATKKYFKKPQKSSKKLSISSNRTVNSSPTKIKIRPTLSSGLHATDESKSEDVVLSQSSVPVSHSPLTITDEHKVEALGETLSGTPPPIRISMSDTETEAALHRNSEGEVSNPIYALKGLEHVEDPKQRFFADSSNHSPGNPDPKSISSPSSDVYNQAALSLNAAVHKALELLSDAPQKETVTCAAGVAQLQKSVLHAKQQLSVYTRSHKQLIPPRHPVI